jgi:hypothetical protein
VPELFEIPDDERGQKVGLTTRRIVMALFALISLAALFGAIGQRASSKAARGEKATLRVSAPERVRGGIFFQAKVEVDAAQKVDQPRLVFADGWLEGMQMNSVEPAAGSETSRDGRLVFSYDTLQPGDRLVVWMQFEVNPTNVGRRSLALELDDGQEPIATVRREITVLP